MSYEIKRAKYFNALVENTMTEKIRNDLKEVNTSMDGKEVVFNQILYGISDRVKNKKQTAAEAVEAFKTEYEALGYDLEMGTFESLRHYITVLFNYIENKADPKEVYGEFAKSINNLSLDVVKYGVSLAILRVFTPTSQIFNDVEATKVMINNVEQYAEAPLGGQHLSLFINTVLQ